jgi:AraC family transcriptional regulator
MIAPIRIDQGSPRLIAGIRRHHQFTDSSSSIPQQWSDFRAIGRLPAQVTDEAFGVMCGHTGTSFEYMCGAEVDSFDALPPSLGRLRLQSQLYAVFRHTAHVSSARDTWRGIIEQWLPESAYQSAEKPDFELYGADFDPVSGLGGFDIWISIERK